MAYCLLNKTLLLWITVSTLGSKRSIKIFLSFNHQCQSTEGHTKHWPQAVASSFPHPRSDCWWKRHLCCLCAGCLTPIPEPCKYTLFHKCPHSSIWHSAPVNQCFNHHISLEHTYCHTSLCLTCPPMHPVLKTTTLLPDCSICDVLIKFIPRMLSLFTDVCDAWWWIVHFVLCLSEFSTTCSQLSA